MQQKRRTLKELNLLDDFLMTESMLHKETAELVARLIIERTTGIKVKKLIIECQKTINGIDMDHHGVRLDVSLTEVQIKEEGVDTVRVFDIEPNIRKDVNLPRRSRYYQALEDVKLLEAGVDYGKLPELWSIWILPYDPFGQNQMVYTVKNIVEGFEQIEYNDGIRKWFLYTDGVYGGSPKLKKLLAYLKHSSVENAVDEELAELHPRVERLKNNHKIGVKYMHVRENFIFNFKAELEERVEAELEERVEAELEERVEAELEKRVEAEVEKAKSKAKELALEQGMEQGAVRKLVSMVCKKLQKGKSIPEIAEELEESESIILEISRVAKVFAPEYDVDAIYQRLKAAR